MASKSECAKLSMAVYSDVDVAVWTKLPPTAETSGFFADAYRNDRINEVLIVCRGTEFRGDLGNFGGAFGHRNFIDLLQFARQICREYDQDNYQVSVTSHSLFGGLEKSRAA